MYPRYLTDNILRALADTPVIFIQGARQTGKSTLAKNLVKQGVLKAYYSLDDAAVLASAGRDPDGFLEGLQEPAALDEVQRVPELFRAIKVSVDRDRRPGRYLLTGSSQVLLLPKLSDTLAGRMEILTLHPLSQGEIGGTRETFLDELFSNKPSWGEGDTPGLKERILAGGYPEAVARAKEDRRGDWFKSYVTTVLQRDIVNLARVEGLAALPDLLVHIAARVGFPASLSELSTVLSLPFSTLRRYTGLLEATFLTTRIQAWSKNASQRLIKAPKIYLTDTGLMAHLLGVTESSWDVLARHHGPLAENFIAMEIARQASRRPSPVRMHHFRTSTGREVDLVLEDAGGRVVGIEVKAGSAVKEGDLKGMEALAQASDGRFHRGVVLYGGRQVVPFSKNVYALPHSLVWTVGDRSGILSEPRVSYRVGKKKKRS